MNMETIATFSLMERILFFKRVPLFANLSPGDIKQVAALAEEVSFGNEDIIVRQGELGDVMFIIVSGEVRVSASNHQKEIELARRRTGEFIGEMALISKEPRSATVTAVGDVRTLSINQRNFESLLRDRPDASLAVIQILCERLKQADQKLHSS
jgi:CRP-like cAMP-binding protein